MIRLADTAARIARRVGTVNQILIVAASLLATAWFFRELIPSSRGFGDDGVHYAWLARGFDRIPLEQIDQYRVQRILPALVVHYTARTIGARLTDANIITGFSTLNFVCVLLTVFFVGRCGLRLGWRPATQWLGLISVLGSHAVIKFGVYYPVLNDMPALALGAAMVFCYVTRRSWWLVPCIIAGLFTWPTAAAVGGLFLALPPDEEVSPTVDSEARWRPILVGAFVGLAVFLAVEWVVVLSHLARSPFVHRPLLPALHLSAVIAGTWLGAGFALLSKHTQVVDLPWLVRLARRPQTWVAAFLLAAGVAAPKLLTPLESASTPARYLESVIFFSGTLPGIFLLAHLLFFGPVVLFLLLRPREVAAAAGALGPALPVNLALLCFMALNSESRQLMLALPLLTVVVLRAADGLQWTRARVVTVGLFALLLSKVWMEFNTRQVLPLIGRTDWRFYYWSSHGPWMRYELYAIQGLLALLLVVIAARLARSLGRSSKV